LVFVEGGGEMPTIYIDNHAKGLLERVKNFLKNKGMSGQSYSDVIRYLYRMAEKELVLKETG